MSLLDFVVAILLATLGVSAFFCLACLLLGPVIQLVKSGRDSSRLHKALASLATIDALISNQQYPQALAMLRNSLLLDRVFNPAVLNKVREHHQNVLSRCLIIAEELGHRAENIAEVEGLLLARNELQELLVKVNASYRNLKSRRTSSGKKIPGWSKAEFETRLNEVKRELTLNDKMLGEALNRLFESLSEDHQSTIVYH